MKVLIKHLKDLIKDEEGNSLMEFALVFPLLILLTLGNIYLSISFTQKADMNGIAFLQARALSVHSPRLAPSSDEIKNGIQTSYIEKSGHNWVEKVKSDYSYSDKDVKVSLIKEPMRIDLLANAISILGGSKPQSGDKITQIKTVMSLPTEYTSGDGDRPLTSTTVDYKTYPVGAVWDYYCMKLGVAVGTDWLEEVKKYEIEVLSKR